MLPPRPECIRCCLAVRRSNRQSRADGLFSVYLRSPAIGLGLLNETKRIVLNLAWMGQIDSSGLGTLVASLISARNRGAEIKLAALSPKARRVLRITNVGRLFEVYESPEEAIKSFHPHPKAAAG